jgi:hypothetical protein
MVEMVECEAEFKTPVLPKKKKKERKLLGGRKVGKEESKPAETLTEEEISWNF